MPSDSQNARPLTPKQKRFVDEYLIDLNATQAAIRAGYSVKTANEQGSRLLANVSVAAAVGRAQLARSQRVQITADSVLAELGRLGFSDMRRFAKWGADGVTLLDSEGLDADSARCVAEVSQSISAEGGSIKFKLHDKPAALVNIGKHLGMFTEKVEHTFNLTPEERGNRIADLLRTAKDRATAANGNGTHR